MTVAIHDCHPEPAGEGSVAPAAVARILRSAQDDTEV